MVVVGLGFGFESESFAGARGIVLVFLVAISVVASRVWVRPWQATAAPREASGGLCTPGSSTLRALEPAGVCLQA